MNRRQMLKAVGSLGIALLAGCTGDESAGKTTEASTPTATAKLTTTTEEDTTEDTDGDGSGNQGDEETNGNGLIFEKGKTHSFSGEGMAETEMFKLDEGLMSIKYQSDSEDIFTAELVAIDVEDSRPGVNDRLILNRMGPIKGELMNVVSGGTYLIDVDVEGPWSFKIDQPSASYDEVMELPFERSGNQPVYFGPINLPEDALIHGEHSGEDGFAVDTITVDGHWDVPVNDSGKVDSTRPIRDDGIAWISVYGRDDWSIKIYEQES